jgi:hypothetical protein
MNMGNIPLHENKTLENLKRKVKVFLNLITWYKIYNYKEFHKVGKQCVWMLVLLKERHVKESRLCDPP